MVREGALYVRWWGLARAPFSSRHAVADPVMNDDCSSSDAHKYDVINKMKAEESPLVQLKSLLPVAVAFNLGLYMRGKRPAFQIDFQEHSVHMDGGMNTGSYEYIIRTFLDKKDPQLSKQTSIFTTDYGQVVCNTSDQHGSLCALMSKSCNMSTSTSSSWAHGQECSRQTGELLGLKCTNADFTSGKSFRVVFEVYDKYADIPERVGERSPVLFRERAPHSAGNPIFMAQMCTSGDHISELFDQIHGFAGVAKEMELVLMRMEINLRPEMALDERRARRAPRRSS